MKKYLIKVTSFIVLFILIIGTPYYSLADGSDDDSSTTLDTSILDESIVEEFNPTNGDSTELSKPFTDTIKAVVNPILGVIQIIGGLLLVVSIAIFGFNIVVKADRPLAQDLGLNKMGPNNPGTKVELLNFGRGMLIGAVFLFAGSTIIKAVFNLFMS